MMYCDDDPKEGGQLNSVRSEGYPRSETIGGLMAGRQISPYNIVLKNYTRVVANDAIL